MTASFLAVLAASAGCSSDTDETNVVDDGKTISSLEITTGITTLEKGGMTQFTAMVKYADGSVKDVSSDEDTVWNTSDPEVATVDEEGMVTAVGAGSVDITATYMGKSAEETFAVMP